MDHIPLAAPAGWELMFVSHALVPDLEIRFQPISAPKKSLDIEPKNEP
jgi:hypothetical protein